MPKKYQASKTVSIDATINLEWLREALTELDTDRIWMILNTKSAGKEIIDAIANECFLDDMILSIQTAAEDAIAKALKPLAKEEWTERQQWQPHQRHFPHHGVPTDIEDVSKEDLSNAQTECAPCFLIAGEANARSVKLYVNHWLTNNRVQCFENYCQFNLVYDNATGQTRIVHACSDWKDMKARLEAIRTFDKFQGTETLLASMEMFA